MAPLPAELRAKAATLRERAATSPCTTVLEEAITIIEQLLAEQTSLEDQLAQASSSVASLAATNAGLVATNGGLESSLASAESTISSQQQTIAAQSDAISSLGDAVAKDAATIAQLSTEVLSGSGTLSGTLTLTLQPQQPQAPRPATSLAVLIGGTNPMPNVAISVDDSTGKASFAWLDDKGEVTPDIPVSADGGAVTVTLACSDPSIATLAADPSVPQTFDITPLAAGGAVESSPGSGQWSPDGSVSIVASATDDQGNPAVFADGQPVSGSTPFGVFPGQAAALAITTTA